MMKRISTIAELRKQLAQERRSGKSIGLVPTMGYLHDGHLSLVREARRQCDIVVMSIFVNPLQFGPTEDFERYPRDVERDARLAQEAGVDYLFHPSVEEMYPQKMGTQVRVLEGAQVLCGRSRPGHFDGVATVVTKLFGIVWPDKAFFGQKDAQQLAIIERMTADLNLPVEVVGCPTVREEDGLAMSSRNVYLSPAEREAATLLYQSLCHGQKLIQQGERQTEAVTAAVRQFLQEQLDSKQVEYRVDYVECLRFPELEHRPQIEGRMLLALAVWIGSTRLIDNIIFQV